MPGDRRKLDFEKYGVLVVWIANMRLRNLRPELALPILQMLKRIELGYHSLKNKRLESYAVSMNNFSPTQKIIFRKSIFR